MVKIMYRPRKVGTGIVEDHLHHDRERSLV